MDLEDNLNLPNSWIPVRALRNALDIKESIKKGHHRKTASSPSASPNKNTISMEVKANSPTSNTIHFNSLHSRYNTSTLDISPNHQEFSDALEKKYITNIARLNEEILIMSTQLKQANETIACLTQRLNESNSKHAMHLQSLHERHEQKIRRNQQDMDHLLREMNNKSPNMALEKIILEKNLEIEVQKRKFQEKIDELTRRFEKQIEEKDKQNSNQLKVLKDQFLDIVIMLKERFFDEISTLQGQYKLEIDRVRGSMDALNDDRVMENYDGFCMENVNRREKYGIEIRDEIDDDLQIMEELSATPGLYIKKSLRESGESDLDMSLKFLINQINLEHDASVLEIIRS